MSDELKELADRAQGLANDLFRGTPRCDNGREMTCLVEWHEKDAQLLLQQGERLGFSGYDPWSMCLPCRAYWWAEMAAQALHQERCIRAKYGKE